MYLLIDPQYEHQKLALTWLKSMEEGTNKGGILADDMGLGKTISALALILTRPPQDRARKVPAQDPCILSILIMQ
jgi:SNF2 family DNA or RNA helicase